MKLSITVTFGFFLFSLSIAESQTTTAIVGATLIDGTGGPPLSNCVVLMKGDRVIEIGTGKTAQIPRGANRIDATGKFLLPGLIDVHLHLESVGLSDLGELPLEWRRPEKLRQLVITNARLDLISGFTTVRDLGSTDLTLQVRDEINAGKLIGPRILAAGMQLVKKDSSAQQEPIFLEYDGPNDARERVGFLSKLGVDVIKVRLTRSRPIPSLEEVRAIVEAAHRLGLRVTVHTDVPADDLVNLAIDAGADGIEHNAPLRSKNERILSSMAQRNMSLMPGSGAFYIQRIDTARLIDSLDQAQRMLLPGDVVSALRAGIDSLHRQTGQMTSSGWNAKQRQTDFIKELERARSAGVLLVFGTDCGAYGMIHGEQWKALYGETQIGSSTMQAIVMATRDAAKAIGRSDELGTIEVGKIADLILLNADPMIDMRNIHDIFRVVKAGIVYDPKDLITNASK